MEFMSRVEHKELETFSPDDTIVFSGGKELHIAEGFKFGPYISDFFDLNYCKSGEINLYLNDKLVKITAGTLYVIPPYTKVEKTFVKDTSNIYILVTGERFKQYLSSLGLSSEDIVFPYAIPDKNVEQLDQMLNLLNTHSKVVIESPKDTIRPEFVTAPFHNAAERKIRCAGLFNLFISDLLSLIPSKCEADVEKGAREKHVNNAIMYITENYNFDISVDVVAKSVGLNRSYLYSLFQEFLGYSVQEFIIKTRINAACNLLRYHDLPIKNVAAAIGYDPVTFSHAFKRITGMTAKEYREKYKIEKN